MKCNFCKIVFTVFALVFSFICFSSSVSATSVSTNFTPPSTSGTNFDFRSMSYDVYPDTSTLDQSATWYYSFELSASSYFASTYIINLGSYYQFTCAFPNSSWTFPRDFTCITSDSFTTFSSSHIWTSSTWRYFQFRSLYSFTPSDYFTNFKFTISDVNPFSSSSTGNLDITENGDFDVTDYSSVSVNVPQTVTSEGQYHNDLVNIQQAIITCGAVLLVLYFFYCIYRIIIKGGKL